MYLDYILKQSTQIRVRISYLSSYLTVICIDNCHAGLF